MGWSGGGGGGEWAGLTRTRTQGFGHILMTICMPVRFMETDLLWGF